MVSQNKKMIGILILAATAITCCHASCPDEEVALPRIFGSEIPVEVICEATTQEPTRKPEGLSKKECECSQKPKSANETPRTEEVVVEKSGKKYRVITITLPMEAEVAQATTEPITTRAASSEKTSEESVRTEFELHTTELPTVVPSEESFTSEGLVSSITEPTGDSGDFLELLEDGHDNVRKQEKSKKEGAKVEKKKYKRDVTSKRSPDKKSSKRKNKDGGKRKSKK